MNHGLGEEGEWESKGVGRGVWSVTFYGEVLELVVLADGGGLLLVGLGLLGLLLRGRGLGIGRRHRCGF